jgi:hypothetical protein
MNRTPLRRRVFDVLTGPSPHVEVRRAAGRVGRAGLLRPSTSPRRAPRPRLRPWPLPTRWRVHLADGSSILELSTRKLTAGKDARRRSGRVPPMRAPARARRPAGWSALQRASRPPQGGGHWCRNDGARVSAVRPRGQRCPESSRLLGNRLPKAEARSPGAPATGGMHRPPVHPARTCESRWD